VVALVIIRNVTHPAEELDLPHIKPSTIEAPNKNAHARRPPSAGGSISAVNLDVVIHDVGSTLLIPSLDHIRPKAKRYRVGFTVTFH